MFLIAVVILCCGVVSTQMLCYMIVWRWSLMALTQ